MSRPNLVLITSHDIGRRLGCYGFPEVASPRLDALAADGVRFERAFCSHPQCSPSRASIATGRYPHSNGVMGLCHGAFGWDFFPEEVHLARWLREQGYRTALAGLQHERRQPDPAFERIGARGDAEVTASAAIEAIDDLAAADTPFYLQVGFEEGHRKPGHPAGEWGEVEPGDPARVQVPGYLVDDAATRHEFSLLHGSIAKLDHGVGLILDALARHGLRERTLIVFTADHGIPFPRAKTGLWDPGIEVALLIAGPGCQAGLVRSDLLSNVDLLPTLCELMALPIPERVQGCSHASRCRETTAPPVRDAIFAEQTYHNYCDPMRCIRTDRHKLIVNFMPCAEVYNSTQQWAPLSRPVTPKNPKNTPHALVELYDLARDPWELANLADDPAHAEIRRDLLARLRAHLQESEDPLLRGELPLPRRFHDACAVLAEAGTVARATAASA